MLAENGSDEQKSHPAGQDLLVKEQASQLRIAEALIGKQVATEFCHIRQ